MHSVVAPGTQGLAAAGALPKKARIRPVEARSATRARCRRKRVTGSGSCGSEVLAARESSCGRIGPTAEEHLEGRFPAGSCGLRDRTLPCPRSAVFRGVVDPVEAPARQEVPLGIARVEGDDQRVARQRAVPAPPNVERSSPRILRRGELQGEHTGVGLVYSGFLAVLAGIVSLLEPLAFLGIPIRAEGLEALACGLGLVAADWLLPAREERAART